MLPRILNKQSKVYFRMRSKVNVNIAVLKLLNSSELQKSKYLENNTCFFSKKKNIHDILRNNTLRNKYGKKYLFSEGNLWIN